MIRDFDTLAIDHIPVRLLVSISLIGVITSLTIFGVIYLQTTLAEDRLTEEMLQLKSKLELLAQSPSARVIDDASDHSQSAMTFDLTIPSCIDSLQFFEIIDKSNENATRDTQFIKPALSYQVQGKNRQTIWFNHNLLIIHGVLRNESYTPDVHEPYVVLTKPGTYQLTFELVEQNETRYILFYNH